MEVTAFGRLRKTTQNKIVPKIELYWFSLNLGLAIFFGRNQSSFRKGSTATAKKALNDLNL